MSCLDKYSKANIINSLSGLQRQTVILHLDQKLFTFGKECKEIIEMKYDELKSRTWGWAAMSFGGGMIPLPGVSLSIDVTLIMSQTREQQKQFGIDKDAIKTKANMVNKTPDEFINLVVQKTLHKYGHGYTSKMLLSSLAGTLEKELKTSAIKITALLGSLTASELAEEAAKFIPLVGMVLAGAISGSTTFALLRNMLNVNYHLALGCNDVMKEEIDQLTKLKTVV